MNVAALNAMPAAEAELQLLTCCGAPRWAREMTERRPFRGAPDLLEAADACWWSLTSAEWLEAFRHHPRIGGQRAAAGQSEAERKWSAGEQAGAAAASADLRDALRRANDAYEQRFGYIFIVCASGKTGEEMLAMLRARMPNDPNTELRVAAEEQRRITHLRLHKLLQT